MACGFAPSAELLIVFRIIQAMGAAALIPASLALAMHAFTHDQLPRAVAIWGAAGAVAGALGPTLGAAIVEGFGWRWAFFINLPVSALYRLVLLDTIADYWLEYFPSMVLSGLGVACVFPQLSSTAAQALPPGRAGVGGAVVQAVRQFSGTFGVALTVAILGASGAASISTYDRIWWLIAAGGLGTSLLALPLRTARPAHRSSTPSPTAARSLGPPATQPRS